MSNINERLALACGFRHHKPDGIDCVYVYRGTTKRVSYKTHAIDYEYTDWLRSRHSFWEDILPIIEAKQPGAHVMTVPRRFSFIKQVARRMGTNTSDPDYGWLLLTAPLSVLCETALMVLEAKDGGGA